MELDYNCTALDGAQIEVDDVAQSVRATKALYGAWSLGRNRIVSSIAGSASTCVATHRGGPQPR